MKRTDAIKAIKAAGACGNTFFPFNPIEKTIPVPRGGIKHDWWATALLYQKQLRKLKKLICAEGYIINSDKTGMPTKLECQRRKFN